MSTYIQNVRITAPLMRARLVPAWVDPSHDTTLIHRTPVHFANLRRVHHPKLVHRSMLQNLHNPGVEDHEQQRPEQFRFPQDLHQPDLTLLQDDLQHLCGMGDIRRRWGRDK
ncbi:AAEL007612-PA [Aedes aegypti]|uniref:AAEL007612-PA n=1 Tax=Aedes aegypti TaxID=7159 RepID=Q171K5_AEDAE|nr:AAEL007612-PA [Aedes aegypti]